MAAFRLPGPFGLESSGDAGFGLWRTESGVFRGCIYAPVSDRGPFGISRETMSGGGPPSVTADKVSVRGPIRASPGETISFQVIGPGLGDANTAEENKMQWVLKLAETRKDTSDKVSSAKLVPGVRILTRSLPGSTLSFQVPSHYAGRTVIAMPYRRKPTPATSVWVKVSEGQRRLSGPEWHSHFANSSRSADLAPGFRAKWEKFEKALLAAGASVAISSTLRPKERAYLMHYSWRLRNGELTSREVPDLAGVAIEWSHVDAKGAVDEAASKAAATKMNKKYGMAQQASLASNHIRGDAIDVYIHWSGDLTIRDASNKEHVIKGEPRHGGKGKKKDGNFGNKELHAVGKSFGVVKLYSDPPHWSESGK